MRWSKELKLWTLCFHSVNSKIGWEKIGFKPFPCRNFLFRTQWTITAQSFFSKNVLTYAIDYESMNLTFSIAALFSKKSDIQFSWFFISVNWNISEHSSPFSRTIDIDTVTLKYFLSKNWLKFFSPTNFCIKSIQRQPKKWNQIWNNFGSKTLMHSDKTSK